MAGTAARRARLRRADDQRRARHAGAGPGRRPRRSRSSPRSAPAIDLLLVRAGPAAPSAGSRRRSCAAAARGLFEADELEASSARLADLRSWLAAAGPPPDLDVVGVGRPPGDLARARGAGADQARSRCRRRCEPPPIAFAPGTRILAIMPEPTDLTPADTSSTVAARSRPGAAHAVRLGRRRRRAGRPERCRDRRPARRAPSRSMPSSSGPSRRTGSRPRRRSSGRSPRPGRRPSRSRCGRRGTSLVYPAGVPGDRDVLDPARLTRRARARARGRDRLPGPPPGRASATRRAAMTPPRRDPRAARGRGAVPRRPGRERRGDRRVAARRPAAPRRHRRPRHVRPRRDLRAVRARRPASADGRARDAVDRVDLRRAPDVARRAGHRHQPVGGVAGHRRGHRRGPGQGAPTIAITNEPDSALAAAADRTIALGRRPGTGDRRDQDLHRRAARDRPAVGRAGRRPGRPRRRRRHPRRRSRARSTSNPRSSGSPPTRRPRPGRSSSPAGSSTRPPASGRSSSRSWPGSSPIRTPSADFQHGPLTLVEPGVPVLAVVRAGAPGADLVDAPRPAARRTRRRADGRLGSTTPALDLATLAGPSAGRDARVARPDRLDRRRAAPRAAPHARARPRSRSARATSARSRARPRPAPAAGFTA